MVGKRDRMCFNFVEISVWSFWSEGELLVFASERSVGLEQCRCLFQKDNGEGE